jgi:hypothetical protein
VANLFVKDNNGKEFSVDLVKIRDINGDCENGFSSSVTDALKNRVAVVHDVQVVDQKGNVIDSKKLAKDVADGKTKIYALDVQMEATHSGKNHNYCVYYEDSMEKDAESFMNPFHKPMLKNHDSYSEPLGRTKSVTFGPSELTDERSAIHLTTRVTDQDAIPKFLDGRYKTVSIGGSMGTVTCNICGKTILKDGKFNFCGHWRGETYKDEVCYWGAKDIEYHEVSTVNNPADDFAQIVKITVVTDSEENNDNNKKEGAGTMGDVNKNVNIKAADFKEKLVSMIDDILGTSVADSTAATAVDGADNQPAATNNAEDSTQTQDGSSAATGDNNTETVDSLKTALDAANAEKQTLAQQLEDAKKENDTLKTEKEDAVNDALAFKDQLVSLAIANKQLIADKVADLEISKGTITDAQKDERVAELVSKSMKDLNATLDSVKTNTAAQQRTPAAPVSNPTLANTDESNAVVVDADGNEITSKVPAAAPAATDSTKNSNEKPLTTIDDYTQSIVGKLFK